MEVFLADGCTVFLSFPEPSLFELEFEFWLSPDPESELWFSPEPESELLSSPASESESPFRDA
jgi:hypothetical protein